MLAHFIMIAAHRAGHVTPTGWAVAWLTVMGLVVLAGPVSNGRAIRPAANFAADVKSPDAIGMSGDAQNISGGWIPTQESWSDQLRSPAFWASRKSGGSGGGSAWSSPSPRSGLTRTEPSFLQPLRGMGFPLPGDRAQQGWIDYEDFDGRSRGGKTFRTMCVRLCDGFYWPVSYATTSDNFEKDAASCAKSCGGPSEAKLFTYRNPGGEIDEMVDLDGRAYKRLQNAFVFRTKYEPSCKCHAHPWEDASIDRHKSYALAAQAQSGSQTAARQLIELKEKMALEARKSTKGKSAQLKTKSDASASLTSATEAAVDAPAKVGVSAGRGKLRKRIATAGKPPATADDDDLGNDGMAAPQSRRGAGTGIGSGAQSRIGDVSDGSAPPSGGKGSIVILRYGGRAPVEIAVPPGGRTGKQSSSRRAADAGVRGGTTLSR